MRQVKHATTNYSPVTASPLSEAERDELRARACFFACKSRTVAPWGGLTIIKKYFNGRCCYTINGHQRAEKPLESSLTYPLLVSSVRSVALAKLDEQGINRADRTPAAAGIADAGGGRCGIRLSG